MHRVLLCDIPTIDGLIDTSTASIRRSLKDLLKKKEA